MAQDDIADYQLGTDPTSPTSMGTTDVTGTTTTGTTFDYSYTNTQDHTTGTGYSIKFDWNMTANGYALFQNTTGNFNYWSTYTQMCFWVKGAAGGEKFKVQIRDGIYDQAASTIQMASAAWRQICIPILGGGFTPNPGNSAPMNYTNIVDISFIADTATLGAFTIYIDDITCSPSVLPTATPTPMAGGCDMVANFESCADPISEGGTALGNVYGYDPASNLTTTATYDSTQNHDANPSGCSIKLNWATSATSGSSVWYLDLLTLNNWSTYTTVTLWVRGMTGGERFFVQVRDGSPNDDQYWSTKYAAGGAGVWTQISLPIPSGFSAHGAQSGPWTWATISDIAIVTDPSQNGSFTMWVDDIQLCPSAGFTPTPTPSGPTNTPTPVVPTMTPTPMGPTSTPTQTYTTGPSQTSSMTFTPSATGTQTLTPSVTYTPLPATFTFTSTATVTSSLTVTSSPTGSPTPSGKLSIMKSISYPCPVTVENQATIYAQMVDVPTRLDLKIYTVAGRLIRTFGTINTTDPAIEDTEPDSNGIYRYVYRIPFDLRDNNEDYLANGLYYYVIVAYKSNVSVKTYGKLVILK